MMEERNMVDSAQDWKIYRSIMNFENEIKENLKTKSIFLSHINDLKVGYKKPLPQLESKKFLFKIDDNFKIGNNICPHQGSLIIDSVKKDLSCRFHGWTWDDDGKPIDSSAPISCKNSSKIILKDAYISNSLVFSSSIDLSSIGVDLSFMDLIEERIDIVNTNFINVIDVFLDVDHIPVVHKNVYDIIGISDDIDVRWRHDDWGSVQTVYKTKENSNEFYNNLIGIEDEKLSAVWITVYPYTMIEWQPGALFVTICIPKIDKTDVLVMKYRDTRYNEINWNINSSTWETAWHQDKKQSEMIFNTLEYHPNLDDSKIKFRDFLFKK